MLGLFNSWSHRRFRDLLSPYIDHRLDEAQAATLEGHLVTCGHCQEELQTLRATVSLLQALPHAMPTRSFALTERPEVARAAPAYLWGMRAATAVASLALMLVVAGDLLGTFSRDIALTSEAVPEASEERGTDVEPSTMEAERDMALPSLVSEADALPADSAALPAPIPSQVQAEAGVETEETVPVTALEAALASLLVLLALVTLFATWRFRRHRSLACGGGTFVHVRPSLLVGPVPHDKNSEEEEDRKMKRAKWLLVSLTLTAVLTLGVACSSAAADTPQGGGITGGTNNIGALGDLTSVELAAFMSSLSPSVLQGSDNRQAGIWVTGLGKVTIEPDLTLLSLGVETRADTVEEARAAAAAAMTRIIDALKANGIADRDIQTRFFNISPEYTYQEVFEDGRRYNKQVLTGYRVTNSVTAKVRNLDVVGETIDDVVRAGGDASRIQSIRFTVEDSLTAQVQARESAMMDALAKADQLATLTGVTRGSLLFITESGGSVPVVRDFARLEAAAFADSVATPISAGELEVQVSVQAVFAIVSP